MVEFGLSLWFELYNAASRTAGSMKVLSSFFVTNSKALGYSGVAHWTKRWSPFDFDFIVIPIHDVNHWYSCIVIGAKDSAASASSRPYVPSHPVIQIISIDSLDIDRTSARDLVSTWLNIEYAKRFPDKKVRTDPPILSRNIPVPRQPNYHDCGLYMIHNVNRFIRHSCKILQAIEGGDNVIFNGPEVWRHDLALHARADFAVDVRRYAHSHSR
ncbi:hypothetical protein M422DRAFT_70784 [Sphaerobolus stellatus SS14]|uniref:Ubiquitin-like protease family profile domain-containing protein n=1 Tax=Sphaerobolus stellatus (strain SS14) TaxID=990650 RepID=A0A0C9URV2_SPHS4|nr:hypothetical protein M422DRAFT_70784 [Sphaerobolus stellatus SS14]